MMSSARRLFSFFDSTTILIFAFLVLIWLFDGENALVIYAASYAFHLLNLDAFLFRRDDVETFASRSMLFRGLALATLAYLMIPHLHGDINPIAIAVLLAGVALHAAAFRALGVKRAYYGVELGAIAEKRVQAFPYNVLWHPMALGCCLEFVGFYLLSPTFNQSYPYLILGHIVFTVATAIVEQFDIHFRDRFFRAEVGTLVNPRVRSTVDNLRGWSLSYFRSHLNKECSMHRYVKTLPEDAISQIDEVRYADEVMKQIRSSFPKSTIVPLPMTDEIYISRYNYDHGGDQGLFDKHYDGNLRFMPAASVVRSLIYLSSNDHLEVVFDTSNKKSCFNTYDYGLLDFHRELHWVNGSYDPDNPPRILLKCNYYIDHSGVAPYRWLGLFLNISVFYVVKTAMEYSKSPKTMLQRGVGLLCNLFRRLNNLSPAAPVALVVTLVVLSMNAVVLSLGIVLGN